jgi:hypothetical protein
MSTIIATPAAQAQAAMHRAQLLLASCRSSDLPAAPPSGAQALWHSEQQRQFLAWLDAGGFAQTEAEIENSGIAPLFSAPSQDSNEESKFSLLRINDAVE